MTHNDIKAKLIAEFRKLDDHDKYNAADNGFLSRTYDEIARAAAEASRLEPDTANYENDDTENEKDGYNAAIAQSSRQLADYFGELVEYKETV